jgi:sugar O-acyltransferase (sialic acid O-acetyltransferase NeuD family)
MAGHSTKTVRPVAVFGGAGGGVYAAMVLRRIEARGGDQRFLGLLNDIVPPGAAIGSEPVLGPFAAWCTLPDETAFLAPLHKVKEAPIRAVLIEALGIPDARWARVVDPDAIVAPDAVCAPGSFLAPHSIVMPAARIGRHVAVRQGATVSHDTHVDDFCMIAINVCVAGYARIETGAHLGPGALIREGLRIGRYSIVGMGAVVIRDVPDFAIVAGNPARVIGEVPQPEGSS